MNTAAATVLVRSLSNVSRAGEASGASPIRLRAGQKLLTRLRKRASAPSAGSVATTSKPLARKQAAQLAPMTPVPTTATWADDAFAVVAIFCCPPCGPPFKSWAWPCANKADIQKHSQLLFALFGRSAERTGRHQPPHTNGRPNSAASVACVWMTQLGTCVIPEVASSTAGE